MGTVVEIGCWIYGEIPGAGKGWTLAVLATSQADADQYVKTYNGGGRRLGKASQGKVKANCGAVTEAARQELERRLERNELEVERTFGVPGEGEGSLQEQ